MWLSQFFFQLLFLEARLFGANSTDVAHRGIVKLGSSNICLLMNANFIYKSLFFCNLINTDQQQCHYLNSNILMLISVALVSVGPSNNPLTQS